MEHVPIDNPYRLFYNIYYEDTNHQTFDVREYHNKIVKVIVRQKTDTKKFEKFVDKITEVAADIKVVENFDIQDPEEFEVFESEDTLSILNRYIQEAEIQLDKSKVQNIMRQTYQEACELI
jgi:hypothetical protein|tara:strand:- start:127 stop:489 length:363 start_codon:yes stop_codon:yes gene_type:complete